jgi:hypothetical protein
MAGVSVNSANYALDTFLSEPGILYGVTKRRLEWITIFLNTESEETYNNMVLCFANAVVPDGFRLLITLADGTTIYDSSRGSNNKYSNIRKITVDPVTNTARYAINENHNSRPEFLIASAAEDGRGFSARYSSSVDAFGYNAVLRVGPADTIPVGCVRVSIII